MTDEVKTLRSGKKQQILLEKAKTLPKKAGCYLMKRKNEEVIYVGKAKDLKSRVSSYFNNSTKSPKTEILVSHISDFEFVLTDGETEAFILENNLIKKHSPRYNIMLRDDKSYPYVLVDHNEPFPRLQYIRKVKRKEGVEVFGPFVHGSNISEVLRIATKSFQLRDCSLREFNSRKEACLLYQIKQCSAPCVEKISKQNYIVDLEFALNLFRGNGEESVGVLRSKMEELSEKEEFEHAAILRDYISVLDEFLNYALQENVEFDHKIPNVDVVSYHVGEVEIDISIYMLRNSILLGHKNFHFPVIDCDNEYENEVTNFLFQYYTGTHDSLPEVLISKFEKENQKIFSEAMKSIQKVKVKRPGKKFEGLHKLTTDHAYETQRVRITNQDSVYVGLNRLRDLLELKERPIKLECYDIAIFQGKSPTASQVVFIDGKAVKKQYKHYHLQELLEGNNDFAMMKEVIQRRVKHGELPDVFIVDGGKGQMSSFKAVLDEEGINIPVCGIAKSKSKSNFKKETVDKSEERLFVPGRLNPYYLNKNKSLFMIITQMRDEAHRFSRRLHHKAEKKRTFQTWVDQVEGVGPKIREKILIKLDKSLDELRELNEIEIANYFDVNKKIAKGIIKVISNE